MLELSGLFLGFGGVNVIRDLSLRVARGERLVILGPNGAGKTSLLRLIAGEARPQQGNIWLHHRDITREGVPARARAGIGRGFQQTSLFTGMTLRENLSLASGGHAGVIEHLAGQAGLGDLDRPVASVDYGTARRLDLVESHAGAIAGDGGQAMALKLDPGSPAADRQSNETIAGKLGITRQAVDARLRAADYPLLEEMIQAFRTSFSPEAADA